MKHLLKNWDDVKGHFASSLLFISDYDGTLTPIVNRPEDAELSEEMRKRLIKLKEVCPVGIMSGRSLEDLKSRVNVEGIYYSGNHGYEIEGPDLEFVKEEAEQARSTIEEFCESVQERSSSIDGVLVENKGFTASVHYRLVDEENISKLKRIMEGEVEPYQEERIIETSYGKKVFEIRPRLEWDKGKAVSLLREVLGFEEEGLTVYLGDDTTDEDAFSTLGEKGLGVLVSENRKDSVADFRLNEVSEVGKFADRLRELKS